MPSEPDAVRRWAQAHAATVTVSGPSAAEHHTALKTAGGLGHPVVCGTHFQTARDNGYLPGPGSRLLTSHQPPEEPLAYPASSWHAHLPPNPTQADLSAAVGQLLMASAT